MSVYIVGEDDGDQNVTNRRAFTTLDAAEAWISLAPKNKYFIEELPLDCADGPPRAVGWLVRRDGDLVWDAIRIADGGPGRSRFPLLNLETPECAATFRTDNSEGVTWALWFTTIGDAEKSAGEVLALAGAWVGKHGRNDAQLGFFHPETGALLQDTTRRCQICQAPLSLRRSGHDACEEHQCPMHTCYGRCWQVAGHTGPWTREAEGKVIIQHRVGGTISAINDGFVP
ncbi:MAG: hypothetical protein Q7R39_11045 [Dehalococcoidia bacterium]|nr:hypothetical protein [Dehalococcoidia bacterium]